MVLRNGFRHFQDYLLFCGEHPESVTGNLNVHT